MLTIDKLLKQAEFQVSAAEFRQCPNDEGFEVAFVGRSNAGKSSALNALTEQNKLAKTSKTPGRTQLLNFFKLDAERRLVDLPGYGFAQVPEATKLRWQRSLQVYLEQRQSLCGLILLVDVRHLLKDFDQQMVSWAVHQQLPVHILLTKADKLARGAASKQLLTLRKDLAPFAELVSVQLFSALKKQGLDEVHQVLTHWFDMPTEPTTQS